MLSSCIFIYVLQSTTGLSISQTKRDILSYWKTTDVTDRVPDYWNHGPIVTPREKKDLSDAKTRATQAWLLKKRAESLTSKAANETKTFEDSMTRKTPVVESTPATRTFQAATEVASTAIIMRATAYVSHSIPVFTESIAGAALTPITKDVADISRLVNPKFTKTAQTSLSSQATTTTQTSSTDEKHTPNSNLTNIIGHLTVADEVVVSDIKPLVNSEFASTTELVPKYSAKVQISSTDQVSNKKVIYFDYDATKRVLPNVSATNTVTTISTLGHNDDIKQTTNSELLKNRANEDIESMTEPFSVFLEKFFKVLSNKSLKDLPLLIDQFKNYVSMLLTGGQLSRVGMELNSIIAKTILLLDHYTPDMMRDYFNTIHSMLVDRKKKLPKYINNLLDYMDDLYDEAEEEAMQAVLYETTLFPNTKNNDKIAQGFVDYVFLKPMLRVAGTLRGNILFQMIITAVKKRNELFNNKDERDETKNRVKKFKERGRNNGNFEVYKQNVSGKNFRKDLESRGSSHIRLNRVEKKMKIHKGKKRDRNRHKSNNTNRDLYKITQSGAKKRNETNSNSHNKLKSYEHIKTDKKTEINKNRNNKMTTVYETLSNIKRRIETVLDKLDKVLDYLGRKYYRKTRRRSQTSISGNLLVTK